MQKLFQKTIALTFLIIFLSGLLVPLNQTFADNAITLSTNPSTVKLLYQTTITATLATTDTKDRLITFSITGGTEDVDYTLSYGTYQGPIRTCLIKAGDTSCNIVLIPKTEKTFTINATWNNGSTPSPSATTVIMANSIGVPVTPLNCVSPAVLNADKTACVVPTNTTYTPLAPLPGLETKGCKNTDGSSCVQTDAGCKRDANGNIIPGSCTNPCPFGNYLNIMIKIVIGFAAVLAMVMIVTGGIEYMTSELISSKEAGKERITHAVLGLLLALGAFLILNTINPQLLSACLDKLPTATITISLGGENTTTPFQPINQATLQNNFGVTLCNGTGGKGAVINIGKQFIPQTEYSQDKRNTTNSSTIFVDCSSFVDQVYSCAGLPIPGNTTADIFSKGTAINQATYDFNQLHSGDLVGWKPSDDSSGNGHVAIWLGNGKILDTQDTNNPTAIRDLSSIQSRIKYVYWP